MEKARADPGLTAGLWVGLVRRWIRTRVSGGWRGGSPGQAICIHSEGWLSTQEG